MGLVLQYVLVLAVFGYTLGKPFSAFKNEDTHARNKRQLPGYPSRGDYEVKLASTRNAARDLGMTFCNGDPLAGVVCSPGINETCVQWREMCDGFQVCGTVRRNACLQETFDTYGVIWYDHCNGDESSDFCRLKDFQPVRCGRDITLYANQIPETISSPNHARGYYSDMFCFWRVTAPVGSSIKVTFIDFATELNYDSVSIGRGPDYQTEDSSDFILHKLNGDSMPDPSTFLTGTNEIFVTFTTDAYDNDRGFVLKVQTAEEDDDTEVFVKEEPEINTDCGEVIVLGDGEEIEMYSPNFPHQYDANSQCDWRISIPLGRQVGINVNLMEIETKSDTLVIGSGTVAGDADTIVERLVGNNVPNKAIVVPGNEAWIRFNTDSSIQRTGFHFTIRDQPIEGCGGEFVVPIGGSVVIGSSNYPDLAYRVNEHCEWRFEADGGRKLTVRFLDFDTQRGSDIVSVGFGNEPAADWSNYVVVEHSGDYLPELDAFDTKKGAVWVSFRSDSFVVARGFKILVGDTSEFESGNIPPVRETHNLNLACGGSIGREDALSSVMIKSPSAEGGIYPPLLDCVWTIDLPFGGPVSITFDTFQTEYNRDVFTIGNGTDPTLKSSTVLDNYSGLKVPRKINAYFQSLWIRFQSDLMHNFRGWQLHITPIPNTECGGVIIVPEGGSIAIASPGYPRYYNKMECRYTIQSAVGNRILFTITEFATEIGDELTVGEGCQPNLRGEVILNKQSVNRPEINYQFMTRDSVAWMYFSTRTFRYLKGWIMNLADSSVHTEIPSYNCTPYTTDPTNSPSLAEESTTEPPVIEMGVTEETSEEELEVIVPDGAIEADEQIISGGLPDWYDDLSLSSIQTEEPEVQEESS